MTAFAGIVTFDGPPTDIRTEEQVSRAVTALRTGRVHKRRLEGALFVQQTAAGAIGGLDAPLTSGDGRSLFAADVRLDNRAEIGGELGLPPPELARTSDRVLLLRMFERWGDAGIARCIGAFAFALWDATARRLILGRDCLGNRALFFHRGPGFVAFATTLSALLALPRVPREIDEIALADLMVLNLSEPRRTFYRSIERVPNRTLVTIDRDAIHHRRYWSPVLDAPPPYRREEDYIARARELFDQAVAAVTADLTHVAIATSGGLDSSAIAATVARLGRAESITCFTIVPPAGTQIDVQFKYLDERDKVEALARMYPALDVRFHSREHPHPYEDDITRFFARASIPVHDPITLEQHAHHYDAVVAAGHRTLLVGNYGNFGLTWDGAFSLLALIQDAKWRTFARELHALARDNGRGLARTFAAEVVKPAAPAWLRRAIHRLKGRDPDNVAWYSALNPAYIAECDLTRQWRETDFDPWFGAHAWKGARHRARALFDRNQFGRDYNAMFGELRGHDLRDPHADRRLLEFSLSVPEWMYRQNGVARSFGRAVFADRLPREILEERRRGALTVAWFRSLDARRESIAAEIERLDSSPLARRLVDLPRLKRLMHEWPADEHAAEKRLYEYRVVLSRGVHIGRFVRWVEGGNA